MAKLHVSKEDDFHFNKNFNSFRHQMERSEYLKIGSFMKADRINTHTDHLQKGLVKEYRGIMDNRMEIQNVVDRNLRTSLKMVSTKMKLLAEKVNYDGETEVSEIV